MNLHHIENTIVATMPLVDLPVNERLHEKANSRHLREQATITCLLEALGLPAPVCHHPDGSPYINGFQGYISISHSLETAVVAVNIDHPIGIDTETWRPQLERVSHKFLSQREYLIYNTPTLLLKAWCMKEAAYKAAGQQGLPLVDGIILPESHENTILVPSANLELKVHQVDDNCPGTTILCVSTMPVL